MRVYEIQDAEPENHIYFTNMISKRRVRRGNVEYSF